MTTEPTLLAVLLDVLFDVEHWLAADVEQEDRDLDSEREMLEAVRAAIAKAKGEVQS